MKKWIFIFASIVLLLSLQKHQKIVIPKEAIRFRVIASSNQEEDQKIKKEIVNQLKPTLMERKGKDLEEARTTIQNELPRFETVVQSVLQDQEKEESYQIQYGMHYFPRKEYHHVIYEEGEYESLVITLGEGEGDNFWCVLFPPICFLEENEEVEYHSFLKDIIQSIFHK